MLKTRRRVLGGAACLVASLAGCAGSADDDPSGAPADAATGTSTSTPSGLPPSCETAEYLFMISPRGVTVHLAERASPETIAADGRERVEDGDAVSVVDTATGAAVEFDAGQISGSEAREAFADREGVRTVVEGRSLPTVRGLAEQARTALGESFDPGQFSVTVVERGRSYFLVVGVSGADAAAVLGDANALEFRVATDDGERRLVGTDAVESASGETKPQPSITVGLTDGGRKRFARVLREVGAMDDPRDASIRLSLHGERVFEGSLDRGLADEIQTGEWAGDIAVVVEDAQTMREIETAMNVFSFDVATRTSLEHCE